MVVSNSASPIAAWALTYQRVPKMEKLTLDDGQRGALKGLSKQLVELKTQWGAAPNPDLARFEPVLAGILKLDAGPPEAFDRLLKNALTQAGSFTPEEIEKVAALGWHFSATSRSLVQKTRDDAARAQQKLQVGDVVATPYVHHVGKVTAVQRDGNIDVTLEKTGQKVSFPAKDAPFKKVPELRGIRQDMRVVATETMGEGTVLGIYTNGVAHVRYDKRDEVWTSPLEVLTPVSNAGWAK